MTAEIGRRWDDAVEQAWVEFRQRVADRLAEMGSGETLIVELSQDDELEGAAPYCQVMADGERLCVEAVSNAFLAPEFAHDKAQESALCDLGFTHPEWGSSPNFAVDVEQREADRAAAMMVRALREVYGILHPVYLDAGLQPQPVPAEDVPAAENEERVVFPEDVDELRAAVHRVATSMLGREPEWDDDGDLPLFTDKTVVYVTLSRTAPRALMFSNLVDEVVELDRALVEVNLLNKHEFGLTFVLKERRIHVRRELPVGAFMPEEFKAELQRLADHVDEWVSELLLRVGGRAWLDDGAAQRPRRQAAAQSEPEPEDQRFRQALRVLRELEGEERGSVDPATMLRIFHADRDLLLAAIRHSAGRATTWGSRRKKAEDDGKAGYARMCRSQQRYYLELRGRRRRALRLAVQASAKRERQTQLTLFSEDEAASS